jgi:hypothetical protein
MTPNPACRRQALKGNLKETTVFTYTDRRFFILKTDIQQVIV